MARNTRLIRQWEILVEIHRRTRGASIRDLMTATGVSRRTISRDLQALRESPLPLVEETINGEVRHRLSNFEPPELRLSSEQLAALFVARESMRTLKGTRAFELVDGLVTVGHGGHVSRPSRESADSERVALIDAAIRAGDAVEIAYRGLIDEDSRRRKIAPRALRVVDDQLYIVAFDLEIRAWRVFKGPRVEEVRRGESVEVPTADLDALFRDAVGVWVGEQVEVEISLTSVGETFAREWPLSTRQEIEGGVLRATVAGEVEALRWVLRMGREAAVRAPASLRARVADEIAAMSGPYEGGTGSLPGAGETLADGGKGSRR